MDSPAGVRLDSECVSWKAHRRNEFRGPNDREVVSLPRFRGLLRFAGKVLALSTVLILGAWSSLAVYYLPMPIVPLRFAAAVVVLGALAFGLQRRSMRTSLVAAAAAFIVVLGIWIGVRPDQSGEFPPETRELAQA